jgi:integrase
MLISCPECDSQISDKAISCPHCGYPMIVQAPPARAPRRKKKHRKLPNGYGSIRKLSGKRQKPYAVYPPVKKSEFSDDGVPPTKLAVGYYETWYDAYNGLMEYQRNPTAAKTRKLTFAEVYELFFKDKYENSKRTYGKSSRNSTRTAYKNCAVLHNRIFSELVTSDLQSVVDGCELKHSSLELITSLYNQMYGYAIANNIVQTDYAQYVKINIPDDDEPGVPFTEDELRLLWKHSQDNDTFRMILILAYSGFRISAFENMSVNTEENYFQGGVKNDISRNRIVPIHSAILPFLPAYTSRETFKSSFFRSKEFTPALESIGMLYAPTGEKHTPHDCRHTFSWLCDKYKVSDTDKHLLMGHKLKGDTEKIKYTHRTIEELRAAIELIEVPYLSE